jgi:AraC-like DNA-binding protein
VEALVHCLGNGDVGEDRSALRRHAAIMRKFYEVVENNADEALFIPDLCAAIGTTERTLRTCCEEHLGTSPNKYLVRRRMSQARRTLRDSDKTATTVTEVAARWGFWNFGRFATEYKSLFGELPSATLARPYD